MSDIPTDGPSSRAPESQASRSVQTSANGIYLAQKNVILANLREEIAVRARRLRAQYGTQADGVRTRVEFRANRIPRALRKEKLGDLMKKYHDEPSKPSGSPQKSAPAAVPHDHGDSTTHSPQNPARTKRPSDIAGATDKENGQVTNPKKRLRGIPPAPPADASTSQMLSKILSPKSSNYNLQPKAQPARKEPERKSHVARPASPVKPKGATGIINNMMERAKSTRAGAAAKKAAPHATTTTAGAGRGTRKAAVPRAPTRNAKRVASTASEASDSSAAHNATKKAAAAAKKAPVKRTVMSTIKGIGGGGPGKKAAAAAAPKPASRASERVLRKRN